MRSQFPDVNKGPYARARPCASTEAGHAKMATALGCQVLWLAYFLVSHPVPCPPLECGLSPGGLLVANIRKGGPPGIGYKILRLQSCTFLGCTCT